MERKIYHSIQGKRERDCSFQLKGLPKAIQISESNMQTEMTQVRTLLGDSLILADEVDHRDKKRK